MDIDPKIIIDAYFDLYILLKDEVRYIFAVIIK